MSTPEMLEAIRDIIAQCDDGERVVIEALCAEAEWWRWRLEELKEEDAGDE